MTRQGQPGGDGHHWQVMRIERLVRGGLVMLEAKDALSANYMLLLCTATAFSGEARNRSW